MNRSLNNVKYAIVPTVYMQAAAVDMQRFRRLEPNAFMAYAFSFELMVIDACRRSVVGKARSDFPQVQCPLSNGRRTVAAQGLSLTSPCPFHPRADSNHHLHVNLIKTTLYASLL
jgi:hypothetical protein